MFKGNIHNFSHESFVDSMEKCIKVQPFKCGPDYIDTMFHGAVCGRPSVNLDLFMDCEAEMCGVLPYSITARKADRKLLLGYRRVVMDGKEWRGHEFHYTQFMEPKPESAAVVYDARGNIVDSPVIVQGNVNASYTHLYIPNFPL